MIQSQTDILEHRRLTPMLKQYVEAKQQCPGAILMFRMGDFYEMFFEDARVAAKELDITLTSRDKSSEDAIPMAGVPHHAVRSYIAKLVKRGFNVAICDQVEDPRKAKGIVRREITRVITPGTVADLEALDPSSSSYAAYVLAPQKGEEQYVIALLDLLSGELLCTRCDGDCLGDELRRMGVREVLTEPKQVEGVTSAIDDESVPVRALEGEPVSPEVTQADFTKRFAQEGILGFDGREDTREKRALLCILRYVESTQRRPLKHIVRPRAYRMTDFLVLDEATRRNLELVRTQMEGRRQGSLLWHLDRCRTALGSRLLAQWLTFPLRDPAAIEARLDDVGALRDARSLRSQVRELLDQVRDVERLVGRVAVGQVTPRDLAALRNSIQVALPLKQMMVELSSILGVRWGEADTCDELCELLRTALVEDPPVSALDGGIFAQGYRVDLDELIAMATQGHGYLEDLQRRERTRTGISTLKVRYNKVFGYYIEIGKAHFKQVPADYVRKQTLVNAERFITDELKHYEVEVLTADERRKAREADLFEGLVSKVGAQTHRLRGLSRLLAETDVLISLAQVAEEGRYTRPIICQDRVLQLRQSRHPVVERLLPGGEQFVPNDLDVDVDDRQLLIVTGPNMAGKSTMMRQVALITLLAHMGSFVPAKAAKIGLCDRIFTRVGASDNLGRGQSTFMVEMAETATILRHATDRSLLILDEIGRGTSTFDGVSIAWAVAEHLHDVTAARTLFATHYHELTDLALQKSHIHNVSVAVKEFEGRLVFLRQLNEGAANRSYGIAVARLAGLPESVLERAREVLANLECQEFDDAGLPTLARTVSQSKHRRGADQLKLFNSDTTAETREVEPSAVEIALGKMDPLNMTPLQALAALDELKKLVVS
ncbi:MAG: DNA mismatch repair protein MutS [Myxococcota bacterium]